MTKQEALCWVERQVFSRYHNRIATDPAPMTPPPDHATRLTRLNRWHRRLCWFYRGESIDDLRAWADRLGMYGGGEI